MPESRQASHRATSPQEPMSSQNVEQWNDVWRSLPFPEAVAILLRERDLSVDDLALTVEVPRVQMYSILEGDEVAPLGVIELVAAALSVKPREFLDYRITVVLVALCAEPDRANELFLGSL